MSARVRSTITPRGRRVLRCYAMHRDTIPLEQVAVAAALSITRRCVCYHVAWLCRGDLLEPAPDCRGQYRITSLGRQLIVRSKRASPDRKARRFCRCRQCGAKVEIE